MPTEEGQTTDLFQGHGSVCLRVLSQHRKLEQNNTILKKSLQAPMPVEFLGQNASAVET
jgi:hypothetical protein